MWWLKFNRGKKPFNTESINDSQKIAFSINWSKILMRNKAMSHLTLLCNFGSQFHNLK